MYLLDTNIVRKLFVGDATTLSYLRQAKGTVYISGLVLQEILVRGYDAEITKIFSGASKNDLGLFYGYMIDATKKLAAMNVLPYTTSAENDFKSLKKALGNRLSKSDGRIAVHAVHLGFILVTQNTKDFVHIPGIRLEDWSV